MSQGSNEPMSVSMIIKQRQNSRSSTLAPKEAKGRNSGGKSENLNPVLPPTFPQATKCSDLDKDMFTMVQVYNQLSRYFRSNYSVHVKTRSESGFHVKRYTDQYKSPLASKAHLLQKVPDSKYPAELRKGNAIKRSTVKKTKRKIEDLPDDDQDVKEQDQPPKEGSQSPSKPKPKGDDDEEEKEENPLDEDEVEEDLDEEMDFGTDYAQSYFDNGEGDDDDRDDDDGPTY